MISNLIRGDADFMAASVTYSLKRTEILDYMLPISDVTMAFAIKSMYRSRQYFDE